MQQVEVRDEAPVAWTTAAWTPSRRVHLPASERRLLVGLGDAIALVLALWGALEVMRSGSAWTSLSGSPSWALSLLVVWYLLAPAFDAYAPTRFGHPVPSAVAAAQAGVATATVYFLTPYVSAPLLTSRALMLVFATALVAGLVAWRLVFALVLGRLVAPRGVLIVGAGWAGRTIADALAEHPAGYRLVGVLEDRDAASGAAADPRVLGGREALPQLLRTGGVTDVVVAEPGRMAGDLVKGVVHAYESGINVVPMASLYEQLTGRVSVEHVGGDWIGAMPQLERLGGIGLLTKRLTDLVGGLVGALALLAVAPLVALAIKLDSPGPVFYAQERVGHRGRTFRVWKFRSMVERAEADGRARWSAPGDPRVTRVGRFLRSTRLDELPQMLNVLRGEMSLVGPRPERPAFVAALEQSIPFYRARLLVKPGLTGWAQIKYRYGSSANDALVKLQYDLYYVKHRSVVLDALILAKTVGVVLRLRGT